MWRIVLSKRAKKDVKKIKNAGLSSQAKKLLQALQGNPFELPYEKLTGDLTGYYSRRINIQHRLVYQLFEADKVIKVVRMWSHYE